MPLTVTINHPIYQTNLTEKSGDDVASGNSTNDPQALILTQASKFYGKVPNPICLAEPDGTIIFANEAFHYIVSLKEIKECVGLSVVDLGVVEPSGWESLQQKIMTLDEIAEWQTRWEVPGSRPKYFRVNGVLADSNHIKLFFYDITVTKELHKQLMQAQKLEAAGRLSSGIAHDFKNILNAIIGYSQLLQMELVGKSSEQSRENLNRILGMSHRAVELVYKLTSFTRQEESGESSCLVNEMVRHVVDILRYSTSKEMEIILELADEVTYAKIQPIEFQQIIMNLALNAWDAMENGGVLRITSEVVAIDSKIECYPLDVDPGEYVKVDVEDSGSGMDREVIEKAFQPFFTTKKNDKGTGLGLSITESILSDIQGGMSVKSRKNDGTIFSLYVPVHQAEEYPKKELSQPAAKLGLKKTFTILVVDDELHLREMMDQYLNLLNQNVLSAENGKDAIELCLLHPDHIDLLLLDIKMPGMTGVEVLRRIRDEGLDIPVLIITGYITEDEQRECESLGIHGILEKPFTFNSLSMKVKNILGNEGSPSRKRVKHQQ